MSAHVPVEYVMLQHEEDVEQDGEETQAKFRWIAKNRAPIIVVVGDDEHLADTKETAGEVKHHIPNAPAGSALPKIVHVGLLAQNKLRYVQADQSG